ncbi:16S rRNA (uracil(1498)-N(3))-methyltransferase [Rhodobacterales bacterium HKCCE3408]|nr:16S rRNA (uracil(1498)-N(3))-methyltransferase [Rhodobacterales bacterium HKCCE3408]
MSGRPKIRLFVDHALAPGERVGLSRDQAHYLTGVMRLGEGAEIAVFDGRSGEFRAVLAEASKRGGTLEVQEQTAPFRAPPDLWLLFAPIKKARTDFIVEKATELGAARICPVQTEFTNAERIRRDRLQAHAIEAAEQCGGTYVPEVDELVPLSEMLGNWPEGRRLLFADEGLSGAAAALSELPASDQWAILIGPEGGFSPAERERLASLPFVSAISLGPRILRADTAAVAALTLFQASHGDWA